MSKPEDKSLEDGLLAPQRAEPALTIPSQSSHRGLEEPRQNVLTLATGNEEKPTPFSLSRMISAVLHRVWIATPLGVLLSAVAVGALWYSAEDKYQTFAWLRIRDKPEYIAFPSSENSRRFVSTQVELMRSPVVVGKAAETAEVRSLPEIKEIVGKKDPTNWIKERLSVRPVGRSDLYEISMTTGNAESAATIVSAIVKTYMDFHAESIDSQHNRTLELLSTELKLRQRDCDLRRDNLRELKKKAASQMSGVVSDETGQTVSGLMTMLGVLQQRLVAAEVQSVILRANIASFRETLHREVRIPGQELTDLVEREPRMVTWKQELAMAEESLKSLKPGASTVRKTYEGKIADLDQRINSLRDELRPKIEELARNQVDGGRQAELQRLEDDLAREEELVQYFRNQIAEQRALYQEQGDLSFDIQLAQVDLDREQSIHDTISHRISAMRTEARAPSRIDIVQDAKVPDFPEGTTVHKKMAAIGLAAFFMPFVMFAGYELMVKRIYGSEQLRQETGIDFVGEVSTLPVRRRLRSDREFERQAFILEESVDSLRTGLTVCDRDDRNKVIVVCSAISGEGKTHLSSQLALSWCRGHAGPVLLIDADMRSPGVQEMFDVELTPGLVEVLRGTATLQEAIITDWGEGIHILPAGNLGSFHPDRLISSQRFLRLLEVAREHYSKIIIDVPPILSAHETLLIAKMADGALLCTLRDYSRSNQFQEARHRLDRAGVNIMGAVLNGTPTKSYVYNYGSYS